MMLKRAISVDELLHKRFKTMQFEGEWSASMGAVVERSGSWIIYGESGHGKTDFSLQLAKYLTNFGKVAYDTIEEGARLTFQKALSRQQFTKQERRRFVILNESIDELRARLKKQKSPDFIFIDSLQFSFITKKQYAALVEEFPTKLFIWISHAEGKKPQGTLGVWVEYHSDIKMRVEGFRTLIKSRYEGGEDFIINEDLAAKYWNEII